MAETRTTATGPDLSFHLDGPTSGHQRFVVTSSEFDFDVFAERRRNDTGPGHAMAALAECLGAEIRQPAPATPALIDRVLARIAGAPKHWALARSLVRDLRDGDLIYVTGDDAGLPIGLVAAARGLRIRLAIFYSAPHRRRPQLLSRLLARTRVDLLAVAGADDKIELLDGLDLGRPALLASEQTDTGFFHPNRAPGAERVTGERDLITSCGLEQRDYVTLCEAIDGLDLDVKICAVSPNFTSATTVAIPEAMPDNVEMRRFEFSELRGLYQDAAVTVIPLLANDYSAGMTTMMEAIACGSPVIITANLGLASDFAERDLVVGVPPGDATAMRAALEEVRSDPDVARARADRARRYVLANHSSVRYVELLCGSLHAFHVS